jgi:hypothetical protein
MLISHKFKFTLMLPHNSRLMNTLTDTVSAGGNQASNCTEISANSAHSEGFANEKGAETEN